MNKKQKVELLLSNVLNTFNSFEFNLSKEEVSYFVNSLAKKLNVEQLEKSIEPSPIDSDDIIFKYPKIYAINVLDDTAARFMQIYLHKHGYTPLYKPFSFRKYLILNRGYYYFSDCLPEDSIFVMFDRWDFPNLIERLSIPKHMIHKKAPKQSFFDTYLSKFKWYRKIKGGIWYKHEFTSDAEELTFTKGKTFFARYPNINRYSKVIDFENYI